MARLAESTVAIASNAAARFIRLRAKSTVRDMSAEASGKEFSAHRSREWCRPPGSGSSVRTRKARQTLAPPANLEAQYAQVGSTDTTLMGFGRDRGDREEYGHGDLIFGTGAPTEVYPRLLEWLSARATKVDVPVEEAS